MSQRPKTKGIGIQRKDDRVPPVFPLDKEIDVYVSWLTDIERRRVFVEEKLAEFRDTERFIHARLRELIVLQRRERRSHGPSFEKDSQITDRIVWLLEKRPRADLYWMVGHIWGPDMVSPVTVGNLRAALMGLERQGRVKKHSDGTYEATQ